MALIPRRVKYRKSQRRSMSGIAVRGSDLSFGEFGLKSLDNGWVSHIQLEAARVALTRHVRRGGKVYLRVFPHKPVTKKPAETRMGKGKGEPEYYAAVIRPGTILFEVSGVPEGLAKGAMCRTARKLPMRTKLVARRVRT